MLSTIRRKGGFRDNPSPAEFRFAFTMVLVAELIKPVLTSNCAPDTDSFMLTLNSLTRKASTKGKTQKGPRTFQYVPVSHSAMTILEQNTMVYIAGYLCRKAIAGHELVSPCSICRQALLSCDKFMSDPSQLFVHNKAWNTTDGDFGSLMVPSNVFVEFCSMCETIFRREFYDKGMERKRISSLIRDAICQQKEYLELEVCSERVRERIVFTFVSMRIQYALKFKNREISDISVKRKNRKVQKVMHK